MGLLEDRLHLGRLHDVTLDLELAAHEKTLGIGLAGDEGSEVCVGEVESDYLMDLLATLSFSFWSFDIVE